MKILLIGYGKMGKEIEKVALDRNHEIVGVAEPSNGTSVQDFSKENVDVAIEFTEPSVAYDNLISCLDAGIPVVSGTTGWIDRKTEIDEYCRKVSGTFFYSSNFSIGVNIFFKLNQILGRMMNSQPQYNVRMEEIHHTQKKDKPSGTAISLADDLIQELQRKKTWRLSDHVSAAQEISIRSLREPDVPGTHHIKYTSLLDDIEIKHTANSRKGFAQGAVMAAEWVQQKVGVFSMEDLMQF